jgi:hypothetical protein
MRRGGGDAANSRDVVDEAITRLDKLDVSDLVQRSRKDRACVTVAYDNYSLHHEFSFKSGLALPSGSRAWHRVFDRIERIVLTDLQVEIWRFSS